MENSLMFGNGLNRLSENSISWDDLLLRLKGSNGFNHEGLPNTMTYEKIFLDRGKSSLENELYVKNEIAKAMKDIESNEFYERLIGLEFNNYLTTNYDYAFAKSIDIDRTHVNSEKIYSLRRYSPCSKNNAQLKLWHIHGEINHPKTIQLGLDHYCGSIGKIDSYIKGGYEYSMYGEKTNKSLHIADKLKNDSFDGVSWVELFFNTNVHILGMGMDYSEIDLWWVLTKRARLSIEHGVQNKIIFYAYECEQDKKKLLESLKVEVRIFRNEDNNSYRAFYQKAIDEISKFNN
ncbi:MAG: SIR2 family protein [Campylobacterales bacterium]